jgi:hypothetical protein
MDQPQDRIGALFEPATEPARLRKVSRPILRLIFDGTIAASPGRQLCYRLHPAPPGPAPQRQQQR